MHKNYKYRLVKYEQLGFDPYWIVEWKCWFGWVNISNFSSDCVYTGCYSDEESARRTYEQRINKNNPIIKSIVATNDNNSNIKLVKK